MVRPEAADGGDGLQIYTVVIKSAFVDSGKGMVLQLGRYHNKKRKSKPWT